MSTIVPSISDSYAEYLRIQISRATDSNEVERLRAELVDVISKLYELHKEKVKAHGRNNRR